MDDGDLRTPRTLVVGVCQSGNIITESKKKEDLNMGHACGTGTRSTGEEDSGCSSCSSDAAPVDADALFKEQVQATEGRMKHIKHKIAIMSGKGGVGKTTVTVNLAKALSNKGHSVGILDADVTAPNVAKMMGLENPELYSTPAGLFPPEKDGIKVISMAFLAPKDEAIIWRGPVIMGVIEQFLTDIVWGELDYILIDLPPGTGDEALSIMQLLPEMDGIITVTTPQEVAVLDTRRSMDMAKTMKVHIIGIIENMSGFVCPHCGKTTNIFKQGGGERTAEELKVPLLGRIPIDQAIAEASDSGEPFITSSEGATKEAFDKVVENVEKVIGSLDEERKKELSTLFKE